VDALPRGGGEQFARAALDLAVDPEVGGEPGHVLPGIGRLDLEVLLAEQVAVGPLELPLVDPADGRDLVDAPWNRRHPGGGVQRGRRHPLDRASRQEVVGQRPAVDHRCGFADVPREPQRRGRPVDLAERLLERAVAGVGRAEPLVPGAQALHLVALAARQRVAVRVLVLPADLGREPLVVEHLRRRRTHPGVAVSLPGIERPPLRSWIDPALLDDEPTVRTEVLLARLDAPVPTVRTVRRDAGPRLDAGGPGLRFRFRSRFDPALARGVPASERVRSGAFARGLIDRRRRCSNGPGSDTDVSRRDPEELLGGKRQKLCAGPAAPRGRRAAVATAFRPRRPRLRR